MLSAAAATELILSLSQPLTDIETLALNLAEGRILAQSITSGLDFPHWDNSAMDGYALRWEDVVAAPVRLRVTMEIPAGQAPTASLAAGTAARIFTGSMLPTGADTIVIQENTHREGDWVEIHQAPRRQGEFVRHQGDFARPGDVLLAPGDRLTPAAIAVAAAAQCHRVQVYRRPRVAIFSTGDELVDPQATLGPGQIVDSNQPALVALVRQWGGEPIALGRVPDRPEVLRNTLQQAIEQADIILSTGGVSVGDYDFVEEVLGELGGQIHITSVAIKPGKPLTVATFPRGDRRVLCFGLPGNPVSALVGCWRFVALAFQRVAGSGDPQLPWLRATTTQALGGDERRDSFLWGWLAWSEAEATFTPVAGGHNSGNLINLARANALAWVTVAGGTVPIGAQVSVLWLGGL